ncbi:hypothetical protein ElyMa_006438500 [Elysia marginata]|uniref:CUB domain-containing protein n=1 Tax=Elysia marginata TaxID=1093978 RepID=A0AAV4HW43_9GAST|nr:hypothetical protein ElyMa_006438500 [Elysia marginata]
MALTFPPSPHGHPKTITIVLGFLWLKSFLLTTTARETVYFDKYGHCQRLWKPFDLDDDEYTLKSTGGDDAHESMNCAMSFRAPADYVICLTFEEFEISRCDVSFKIYDSKSAEEPWRTLTCSDSNPSQMCVSSNYVIIKVSKDRLTQNQGYEFEIKVDKSDGVSGDQVLFASIGIFVGIVLGVVVLIAILAGVVLYCCYLQNRRDGKSGEARGSDRTGGQRPENQGQAETLIEPSAPPADDAYRLNDDARVLSHNQQVTQDPPPPYVPPPPYEEEYLTGNRIAAPSEQERTGSSAVK